jgi:two-component system cell cycle response regulator DivK
MASESILIVDDNPIYTKLVSFLLTNRAYQVRSAEGAEEALRVLQTLHPALILVDMHMPDIEGFELIRRLKADPATRGSTIVAVPDFAMKGDEERFLAAGCHGYIPKPIDVKTFVAEIQAILRGRI